MNLYDYKESYLAYGRHFSVLQTLLKFLINNAILHPHNIVDYSCSYSYHGRLKASLRIIISKHNGEVSVNMYELGWPNKFLHKQIYTFEEVYR